MRPCKTAKSKIAQVIAQSTRTNWSRRRSPAMVIMATTEVKGIEIATIDPSTDHTFKALENT